MILFQVGMKTMGKEKINCSEHYSNTHDHPVEDILVVIIVPAIMRKQSNRFKIHASNYDMTLHITYEY